MGVGEGFEAGLVACEGTEGGVVFEEPGDVGGVVKVSCLEAEATVEVGFGGGVEILGGDFMHAVLGAGVDSDVVGDGASCGVGRGVGVDDDIQVALIAIGRVDGSEGREEGFAAVRLREWGYRGDGGSVGAGELPAASDLLHADAGVIGLGGGGGDEEEGRLRAGVDMGFVDEALADALALVGLIDGEV